MADNGRVYIVTDRLNHSTQLVRAFNPAQAIRHVTSAQFEARPAKVEDILALNGQQVANATLTLEAVNSEQAA